MYQHWSHLETALRAGGHVGDAFVEECGDRAIEVEVLGMGFAVCVESRESEQVEDQLTHTLCLVAHRRERGVECLRIATGPAAQHVDVALEGGHRRPQLMRRVGGENAHLC